MATGKFVTLENGRKKLECAIETSTGVADADKILKTDSTGKIDSSFLPNGIGDDAKILEAGEAIDAGDFVNIYDDGGTAKIRKADATNDRPANGFVTTAIALGATDKVFFEGGNNALSGLTAGTRYYLDAAGDVTATAKTATGEIHQFLGVACGTTELTVEMSESVILC